MRSAGGQARKLGLIGFVFRVAGEGIFLRNFFLDRGLSSFLIFPKLGLFCKITAFSPASPRATPRQADSVQRSERSGGAFWAGGGLSRISANCLELSRIALEIAISKRLCSRIVLNCTPKLPQTQDHRHKTSDVVAPAGGQARKLGSFGFVFAETGLVIFFIRPFRTDI